MDRFFLALIISGLLLAAVAVSLFVASSGGERTVSVMNLPPAVSLPFDKPRQTEQNRAMPRDDGR